MCHLTYTKNLPYTMRKGEMTYLTIFWFFRQYLYSVLYFLRFGSHTGYPNRTLLSGGRGVPFRAVGRLYSVLPPSRGLCLTRGGQTLHKSIIINTSLSSLIFYCFTWFNIVTTTKVGSKEFFFFIVVLRQEVTSFFNTL